MTPPLDLAALRFGFVSEVCACGGGSFEQQEDGEYVQYSDYKALLDRLERAERDAKRFAFVATEVLSDTIIGLVDTSEEASIAAAENGREEVTDADRVYALRVAVDSVLKSPPTDAALTPTPEQP